MHDDFKAQLQEARDWAASVGLTEADVSDVIKSVRKKKRVPKTTLEERVAAAKGKLGPYEECDWGDPVGREVW